MLQFLTLSLFALGLQNASAQDYKPIPVPANVRVISSAPRQVVWEKLNAKEKRLAIHLLNAGKAGRSIIFNQNHRYALAIRDMIETALSTKNMKATKAYLGEEAYTEFLNYAAKFEDLMGPYEASNRKYVLTKVAPEQVFELFKRHHPKFYANTEHCTEAVLLLTSPTFEVISQPESADGKDLENSGGNLYQHGLLGTEVTAAIREGLNSNLNCRIVRGSDGKITCEVQALNNPQLQPEVRTALTTIVRELSSAARYALSEHQRNELMYLIKFLRFGDIEDFRKMNIEWVRDGTGSKVDFMMGYVEVYQDYLNQIGAWESYVQIVDPTTTTISANLAKNAQTFENNMPYGEFKKTFPADYAPPAIMVYYFRETSGFHSGGYNLPNFDDIRRDVGAKNVIRLDLPGQEKDEVTLAARRQMYQEFLLSSKVDQVVNDFKKWRPALVLLHEIIGHGSGTYDTTKYGEKEDPIGALGAFGSALEEQRADLAALVFAADPILVKIGFYTDEAEALRVRESMYDAYLGSFLQALSKQRSLTEAHQRGHWLLINKLMAAGAVAKTARDGSDKFTDEDFVLTVKNYALYHEVCNSLLAELQRIKATRDEAELKRLFEEEAPLGAINEAWLQAVIRRGAKLTINSGSIEQPWAIHNGQVLTFGTPNLEGIAPYFGR